MTTKGFHYHQQLEYLSITQNQRAINKGKMTYYINNTLLIMMNL